MNDLTLVRGLVASGCLLCFVLGLAALFSQFYDVAAGFLLSCGFLFTLLFLFMQPIKKKEPNGLG